MSDYITEEELEEDLDYFAEVFAYTIEASDEETPELGEQLGDLAQRYRKYDAEKIVNDVGRVQKTISDGCLPEYPDDLIWKIAAEYAQHSDQFVNRQSLERTVERKLEE